MPNDEAGENDNAVDVNRLFRREGLVSDADLRVEIANELSRVILGEQEVSLKNKSVHTRGNYRASRGSRSREVAGRYERNVEDSDMFIIQASVDERANGGVDQLASVESQAIIGGAYVNTIVGPYLRMTAWADQLVWGGWLEADVARVEISALMIRSHMFYSHMMGARVTCASRLVDDFVMRTENFGVHVDSQVSTTNIGSPGSGVTLEA